MNFSQFLLILRARWWVVFLALLVTVGSTLAISLLLPKSYTSTVSLVVDSKSKDPITGTLLPSQLLPGYLATQVDIIQSQNVALRVVDLLKLTTYPSVQEDFQKDTEGQGDIRYWMANLLLKKLEVRPSRESSVIQLSFTGSDPKFSATIANTFAKAYTQANLDLRVEPARQTNAWYEEQVTQLRSSLEEAQAALTSYQRKKGLVVGDERSIDVETARLAELSSQLVAAQGQTYDTTSRQSQSQNALADVEQNPLVQGLKRDLSAAEASLSQISEKVGKNHPQYQAALAQTEAIRAKLITETKLVTRTVGTSAKVAQGREADIRAALAAQKAKVMALKKQRDEASVLLRDVDNAQRLYDAAQQRAGQSRLESLTTQTDIAVLNPAVPAVEPSSPKILLNTVMSIFLGGLLGLCLGFLAEMIDRRVRSSEDLSTLVDLPVLAELSISRKKRHLFPARQLA